MVGNSGLNPARLFGWGSLIYFFRGVLWASNKVYICGVESNGAETLKTNIMNGLSNLHHIAKQTGKGQCDLSRPECGSRTNGMIVLDKSVGFADRIRGFEKGQGMWKPCLNCLNAAHAQGRIGAKTYELGLEIRKRK